MKGKTTEHTVHVKLFRKSSKYVWLCCHSHRLQHFLSLQIWCDFLLQAMTPQHCFCLKCTLLCMCVGLPPCFKYSQDDRHSIYLDVYCFELLGMGNSWAGIHIRKRALFEQAHLGKIREWHGWHTHGLWMVPLWASDEHETQQFKCFK